MNAQLAHLSYRRLLVAEDDRRWEFIAVVEAMAPILRWFYEHAPQERLHPDWQTIFTPDRAVLDRQWVRDLAAMLSERRDTPS